jgi:hypothetical protein
MSGMSPSTTIVWPRTKRQITRWNCAQMRTNQIVALVRDGERDHGADRADAAHQDEQQPEQDRAGKGDGVAHRRAS